MDNLSSNSKQLTSYLTELNPASLTPAQNIRLISLKLQRKTRHVTKQHIPFWKDWSVRFDGLQSCSPLNISAVLYRRAHCETAPFLLCSPQMRPSFSNTTKRTCCRWPTAGRTPTALSSSCEFHFETPLHLFNTMSLTRSIHLCPV